MRPTRSTAGRASRLGGVLLAVVVLALAGCSSSALSSGAASSDSTAPAGPSGPTITLDPSEGLTSLQRVTVRGAGFAASVQIVIVQCAAGGRDEATCDNAEVAAVQTDSGGAFTIGFRVRDAIATATEVVDCSTAGACDVLAAVLPDAAALAAVGVAVGPSKKLGPLPAPACPSPFAPVGYVRGAVDVPTLPPNVSGTPEPYVDAGAAVVAVKDGDTLLLTVGYQGVTRQFTTTPHLAGGNEDRTPGPSDTPYGLVSIVTADDGAVYVTLEQNGSGDYTRIGWRFDDPCAAA